jgi:sterol desaturase/sphingolipid hydroxylase (fatty acid hydroxylase superfamily)
MAGKLNLMQLYCVTKQQNKEGWIMADMDAELQADAAPKSGYKPPFAGVPLSTLVPYFAWPPRPLSVIRFFVGWPSVLFPYMALFIAIAYVQWKFLLPPMSAMKHFSADWIALLMFENAVILTVFASFFHVLLYVRKSQGLEYKFRASWDEPNNNYLFGNKLWNDITYSVGSGVIFWTAWEAVTFWLYANNRIAELNVAEHPVYSAVLFDVIHRLLHNKWLYRHAHYVHHKSTSPGPWSGMAMHPLEHFIFFSGVAIAWIVPMSPLHAMFILFWKSLSPVFSHSGFAKVKMGPLGEVPSGHYFHELHHKYFNVNFRVFLIPFDRLFGTFCDGTPESLRAARRRMRNT